MIIPFFPVVVALVVPTSEPIIRRADRPDSAYCHLGARSKALVSMGRAGDGTLIGPKWVLTAGHVAKALSTQQPERRTVDIAGVTYRVAATFVHPDWTEMGPHDVGLLRLERAVSGVTPISLYRGKNEVRQVATLLGHGKAGTGADRNRVEDGKARGATSRVDSADAQWLYFSFDAPPSGTNLEGAPGPGDSGGPALITIGGKTYIAGVSSAGYDGVDGPGTYGAIDVFTRVSTHLAWIDSVMKRVTVMSGPPSRRPANRSYPPATLVLCKNHRFSTNRVDHPAFELTFGGTRGRCPRTLAVNSHTKHPLASADRFRKLDVLGKAHCFFIVTG